MLRINQVSLANHEFARIIPEALHKLNEVVGKLWASKLKQVIHCCYNRIVEDGLLVTYPALK
jgi:hypothetical protein